MRWMLSREDVPTADDPLPLVRGGILADEMGLGKTHMIAALMARSEMPTLVIATVATLDHWVLTLRAHGLHPCCVLSRDHATTLGGGIVNASRIVVTTVSAMPSARRVVKIGGEKASPVAIAEIFARSWGRIVLDEAHVIRNATTLLHKTLLTLEAAHRWAVTGAPIQNRERDLQALATWVGVSDLPAAAIVDELVLRRCPDWSSNEGIDAHTSSMPARPPVLHRRDIVLDFPIDSVEAAIYSTLHNAIIDSLPSGCTTAPVGLMIRCRQAASHPRMLIAAAVNAAHNVSSASTTEARFVSPVVRALAQMHTSGILDVARIDPTFGTKARWVVRDLVDDTDVSTRSLVFCDWIDQMYDLRAALLDECPTACVTMYHGRMTRVERNASIVAFSTAVAGRDVAPIVMFVQVQCGAVGINLQAANRVYILGPQWNPTVEKQAVARAYRLGQTRTVQAVHVVMRNTVDVQVVVVQNRKNIDIATILMGRITVDDHEKNAGDGQDIYEDDDRLQEIQPSSKITRDTAQGIV